MLKADIINIDDLQRNVNAPLETPKTTINLDCLTVLANNLEKYIASWNKQIFPDSIKVFVVQNVEFTNHFKLWNRKLTHLKNISETLI